MMRRSILALGLAAALLVAMAAPAWAPRTWLLPSIQGVACETPDGAVGSFSGEITVDRFVVGKAGPEALVQLAGTCVTTTGKELEVDSGNLSRIPVVIVAAGCEQLELLLGPAVEESRDGFVTIDPFKVSLDNAEGSKRLGHTLCSASKVSRLPLPAQVAALNRVLNAS